MLVAALNLRAKPHAVGEVLSALDALAERMRRTPGCSRSRILADVEECGAYTVLSEWVDADAADSFLDSREFQIFSGIRILLREEPYLTLRDVSSEITRLIRPHPAC